MSLYLNIARDNVFGVHDVSNIYGLPLVLRKKGFDDAILRELRIEKRFKKNGNKALREWTKKTSIQGKAKPVTIGIAGKYTGTADTYISILKALEHCSFKINKPVNVKWIETTCLEKKPAKLKQMMKGIDGVIVPGGFGVRGIEGKIAVARYCRTKNVPYLGLCLGFQVALIEFARNVLGLKDANSVEFKPKAKHAVICLLPEQKKIEGLGGSMRLGGHNVELKEGTTAFELHGKAKKIRRRFRHRFECNPDYIERFERKGLVFSGKAPRVPIMQILELPNHRFFVATQYHAEFTSRPLKPDELFLQFVKKSRGK